MNGRLYIYGVAASGTPIDPGSLGPGIAGGDVALLPVGPLLIIVGPAPDQAVPGTRRNMLAHTAVLERALAAGDVLPLRFGTVAPDAAALHRGISGTQSMLSAALAAVAGRIELGVKASWREGVAYREVLDGDPALRALRDRLAARPGAETYYERIELGRRVEAALATRRADDSAAILAALQPLAERSETLKALDEAMVLNHAFLVRRNDEPRFDDAMATLAERHGERLEFRYVGPVPPYNFVSLRADWLVAPR